MKREREGVNGEMDGLEDTNGKREEATRVHGVTEECGAGPPGHL